MAIDSSQGSGWILNLSSTTRTSRCRRNCKSQRLLQETPGDGSEGQGVEEHDILATRPEKAGEADHERHIASPSFSGTLPRAAPLITILMMPLWRQKWATSASSARRERARRQSGRAF